MSKSRKNKTRKNRFKTLTFKLSFRQFKSLQNYSEIKGTTPLKVIKDRINDCIEEYSDEQIGKEKIAKNQLSLFTSHKKEEQQLEMFE
jgi:hypothetical protein